MLRYAFLSWIIPAAAIVYALWLATRFVNAVEKIADRMDRGPG